MKILTLNIGNPSLERAIKQIKWLEQREESVFVLTETKNSEGCEYIEKYFKEYGYNLFTMNSEIKYDVYYPKSETGDLGVMIISKLPINNAYSIFNQSSLYYTRFAGCDVMSAGQLFRIIGLYVPSRDRSTEKVERKKQFCVDVANHIKKLNLSNVVICGDLNVLERSHEPKYSTFFKWEYSFYDFFEKNGYTDAFRYLCPNVNEYSWVGRTNDGYRYDHIFVSRELVSNIINCQYLHETRKDKLTDHSGMKLELKF